MAFPLQALLFLTSAMGWAAPPADGPRARVVRSADQAADEGRLADARDAWLVIWEMEGSRMAACNVGQLSMRVDDMPLAAEYLTICLKDVPVPTDPDGRLRYEQQQVDLARARRAVGTLRFHVREGAELTVDNRFVGRAPIHRDLFVPPGTHRVRAELDGQVATLEVEVVAGEQHRVALDLVAPPDKPHPWVIALGAASSAAFVATGAGFVVAANGEQDDADRLRAAVHDLNGCSGRRACREAADAAEAATNLRTVGHGAIAVGAALAAGTVTYALWPRSSGPQLKIGASHVVLEGTW